MPPRLILSAVTQRSAFLCQVCVPRGWTDRQVKEFADRVNWCGTDSGWTVKKDGDPALRGDPERATCSVDPDYVHVMLDA